MTTANVFFFVPQLPFNYHLLYDFPHFLPAVQKYLAFYLMLVSTLSSSRPTESRCGAHCVADTVHYRCTVLKDEMISPSNRRFLHKVTNFYVDLCGSSGESAGRLEIAIISIYGAKWPERSSWHVQGMASECTRFQSGLHDEIKSEPCCQDIVWNLCAVDIY